jgi:hypothetical protein
MLTTKTGGAYIPPARLRYALGYSTTILTLLKKSEIPLYPLIDAKLNSKTHLLNKIFNFLSRFARI